MKKESFIYSTLTIGGSKEQVNEVMKYICDDIYDIGSIDLNKICAVPVHLNIGPDDEAVSYTHLDVYKRQWPH